ncbi:MAG: Rpn family recombination-promoting nuclease/putative transposase, partial [Cellulosilyticaceae bacterium]
MPIRLFWYMSEIWRKYIKQIDKKAIEKKEFKLPVIVPIVLYNGALKWEVPMLFKEKLQQADLFGNHALNFEYILIDVNKYSKEQLIEIENIVSAIFLLDQKVDMEEFIRRAALVATEFENLKDEHRLRLTDWIDHTIAEPVRESILEMFKTKLSKEEVNEMTANITRTFYEEKEQAEQR